MKLPRHITAHIEHQPHAVNYETAEGWLLWNDGHKYADISPEERVRCIEAGEIWVVQWYPITPVGFFCVAASTLDAALDAANSEEAA